MGLIKDFKDAIKTYTPGAVQETELPPRYDFHAHIIGDTGAAEEFLTDLEAARNDYKAKQDTYEKTKNKSVNKSADAYSAYTQAFDDITAMKKEFVRGATDGFYFDRTKNIQAILADPDTFCPPDEQPLGFAANLLIELLKQSMKPGDVPKLALAAVASDRDRQVILNDAHTKLKDEPADEKITAAISALEKANAGASVPDENGKIMIRSRRAPKKLVLSPVHRFGK
jgi:hypothetical protein